MGMVITYKHDQVREEALVYCSACKTQIGLVEDHLDMMDNDKTGVFNTVFNVHLKDSKNDLRQVNGNTVADVHCLQCGKLIGLKLIAVPEPALEIKEGRFLMKLCKLVYWNDLPMMSDDEQDEGDNSEHAGGANTAQVTNEQDGGANVEQVPDPDEQDGGANIGQVPNDQDGGADEQDPNQDVD